MRHARDDDSFRILKLSLKLNAELQRSGSMGTLYRGAAERGLAHPNNLVIRERSSPLNIQFSVCFIV
jgi:hypothetical protein